MYIVDHVDEKPWQYHKVALFKMHNTFKDSCEMQLSPEKLTNTV